MLTEEDDVEIYALAKRRIGRSRPSPATPAATARRFASICARNAASASGRPAAWSPTATTWWRALPMTTTCSPACCYRELTELGFERSYPTLVRELRRLELRPSCPACRSGKIPTTEIPARAGRGAATRLVGARPRRPGARRPTSSSAPSRTPGGCGPSSARARASRTWRRLWTASCAAWAAPRRPGAPTAWRRSSTPAPTACGPRPRRSPSTTAPRSSSAPPTARSERASSSRGSTT